MPNGIVTLARAFELARIGPCRTMDELHDALKSESRAAIDEHLGGQLIIRQLRSIMDARAT